MLGTFPEAKTFSLSEIARGNIQSNKDMCVVYATVGGKEILHIFVLIFVWIRFAILSILYIVEWLHEAFALRKKSIAWLYTL